MYVKKEIVTNEFIYFNSPLMLCIDIQFTIRYKLVINAADNLFQLHQRESHWCRHF